MSAKRLRSLLLLPLLLLGGCSLVLLDPSGDVARQQSDIMIVTTVITWLIIVPVMVAIGVVAWRYRASNRQARYDPDWDHSPQLELVVWAVPLLIIISVGAVSWIGTHQTDPYRPLDRIAAGTPVPADARPLEVDVISLRWKWLFLYPQYGVASVNELAAPVHYYAKFDASLYDRVLDLCVQSGGACKKQMGSMQGMPAHPSMKMPPEPEVPSASTSGGH
jgi:cytochrome o ubiquinol oxidase subunit 2